MERLTTDIYTFKDKVEDVENQYLIRVQQKLKEYEDLEEQGKLLRLPCEVGDSVYTIYKGEILSLKVLKIEILLLENKATLQIDCFMLFGIVHFLTKDFGETVFLTKEEAEVALRELRRMREVSESRLHKLDFTAPATSDFP